MLRGKMRGSSTPRLVFRFFAPAPKVGAIIGKQGAIVKALRDETGARIQVSQPTVQGGDSVVIVSSGEAAAGDKISPAKAAFLKIYPQALLHSRTSLPEDDAKSSLRLVIPGSQAGALIGKGGATIASIREVSGAAIHISEDNWDTPVPSDRVCVLMGKPAKIGVAVNSILDVLSEFRPSERLQDLMGRERDTHQGGMAAVAAAAAAFAAQHTAAVLGASGAVRDGALDPSVAQVSAEMRVHNDHVGTLLGAAGSTINSIRKLTSASVKLLDKDSSKAKERVVQIAGSPQQVATAQALIQACVSQAEKRFS